MRFDRDFRKRHADVEAFSAAWLRPDEFDAVTRLKS